MLCVHLCHHLQSLARKIQVGRSVCVSVINFLGNKNNKTWATLGISNSEHHREQLCSVWQFVTISWDIFPAT